MSAQEHKVDRKGWPAGPWDDEPQDREEWRHASGMPCLMVRSPHGNWCGYVGVPPGHPYHGKEYGEADVETHGGLTFAGACQGRICHEAKPGEPEPWWLGFDCAHCWDISPGMVKYGLGSDPRAQYATARYVRNTVNALADQLAAAVGAA